MSKIEPKHEKEIEALKDSYKSLYSQWLFELRYVRHDPSSMLQIKLYLCSVILLFLFDFMRKVWFRTTLLRVWIKENLT